MAERTGLCQGKSGAAGEGLGDPHAGLTLSEEREKAGWRHAGLAMSSGCPQAKAGHGESHVPLTRSVSGREQPVEGLSSDAGRGQSRPSAHRAPGARRSAGACSQPPHVREGARKTRGRVRKVGVLGSGGS